VSAAILEAAGLSVRLNGVRIVDDAGFIVNAGEFAVLVGPNGAGKTTLMRAIAGLIPGEGMVNVGGRPLAAIAPRERARIFAYLPQGHVFHWPMSVEAVVALGRQPHADAFSAQTPGDREAVARALAATHVEHLASRAVTTLSGGERARVALARALATEAPVLLADEPTSSLDPRQQLIVMELLRAVAGRGGAVLAIVHDLMLAARFADRVLLMQRGRIVADAPPAEALGHARLAEVFGVESVMLNVADRQFTLPWRPL
jgi:iron complex transport system ATP-binding protein